MATAGVGSEQDVSCPEQAAAPQPHTIMEEYGYKLGKTIGTGSYGIVYEALLEKQKIPVAVKIISKRKAVGEYLSRFLPREVQCPGGQRYWAAVLAVLSDVVCKTIAADPKIALLDSLDELSRRGEVMKALRHRNIINFYQAIETTSRVYLVLELAPQGDIIRRLKKLGPLQECQAGKWFSQLSRGMAYIHSKGIVHRWE
ncbi:hypothetical protein NDU88_003585 [Pleurodeles waltl]|uniref:non-specific serine/threonine protein kinase n=1 Tax=Pleurodeles waltl TaxID=8319 RepID=A0AAV7Q9D8_PLEWA|nr:hypothetical protein NDU88_003585 [Pleurodeles waltl]